MITPGIRIGAYEVTGSLGAGGMGEVYRARDAKLKRDVALKILPDAFANDPDRLARFQREAQVLASLNHPHIAAIYGLEEGPAETGPHVRALVMELVEGEDLAQRLSRGPVPIDEALPIARQIADALEAAHEQGIIHRDLKPANIKVRPDGTVKVLDFGLAKAIEGAGRAGTAGEAGNLTQSPTITSPAMTHAGMILGTAAYMSPEQAKGRPADRRSDVWSFGCVLYEMLAGRRPFAGEDVADTLAHILTKEPDWTVLPASTPAAMRRLLRRCLQRDRKLRLDSAAAARLEIDEALASPSSADRPAPIDPSLANRGSRRATMSVALAWGVALAALMGASVLLVLRAPWRAAPEPARVAFEIQAANPGGGQSPTAMFAVSSDGTAVVARVLDGATTRLFVRALAEVEGTILARTDGAAYPFWSPDGRSVGFFADGKLKTIDIRGGAPQTLADAAWGGTWNREGVILFATAGDAGPLSRVPATGGLAAPVTELDVTRDEISHRFPRFLPDGVHFLFLVRSTKPETGGIYLGSLTSKETHRLVDAVAKPEFAPPDLLLFARGSTLMAQRLDIGSAQMLGAPFRVVEPVGSPVNTGAGAFSVSDNGVLAYRASGGDTVELAWVDRHGKRENAVGAPGAYQNPRLSPDGQRLAFYKADGGGDIWITELDRGNSSKFTFDPATDNVPVWSPDGKRIAFISNRDGGVNIYQKNSGGTEPEELLLKGPNVKLLNDWSPDGQYLVYEEYDSQNRTDLWMLRPDGDRKPSRLMATPFSESGATLSPDGRWMAYTSDESGIRQVYVQRFPTGDRKWHVSNNMQSAAFPRWGVDGKELFFDAGGVMQAVSTPDAGAGNDFTPGAPVSLFRGLHNILPHNFDVTRDGRFLALLQPGAALSSGDLPITVIVNWTSGLTQGR